MLRPAFLRYIRYRKLNSVHNVSILRSWKRCLAVVGNPNVDKAITTITGGRIDSWLQKYEELVGLRDVKQAQDKVIEAENQFEQSVVERRSLQQQIMQLHAKLKELHAALDKVQRGEERYLTLLTEEYEVLREEKRINAALTDAEQAERERFAALSSAVRESHERERARAERTKYWSIIGSAIGATIGIIGTTVNNYRRTRELKSLVRDSASGGVELNHAMSELVRETQQQQEEIKAVMSNLKVAVGGSPDVTLLAMPAAPSLEEIVTVIKKNNSRLEKEITDIKHMIVAISAGKHIDDSQPSVVYVGPEVQELLDQVEESLEMKIKSSAVASSVALYVSSIVTVAVLYMVLVGGRSVS